MFAFLAGIEKWTCYRKNTGKFSPREWASYLDTWPLFSDRVLNKLIS